jgi:flagellar assembly protein FliH
MTAAQASRFSFDTVFGEDGEVVRNTPRQRPKTSFTPEEVEAVRQEAFAQGAQNAEAAANAALANALKIAAAQAAELLKRQDAQLAAIRAEASQLAVDAARHVAGHALAQSPLSEIAVTLSRALHEYHDEPRLVVRLNPALSAPLQARLPGLIETEGFIGRVVVAGDTALRGADCRIEWADGGLERDTGKIFAALEAEIQRWHAAEAAAGGQATPVTE